MLSLVATGGAWRAASQLGPDAQTAVVELNKQGGLSHGKVTRCLESLFGIPLSRGGSVHTVLRAASRCEPVYEAIRRTLGQSDWVVSDETGWREGAYPAWLHTLVGPEATAYVIDPTRSGAVAEAILGLDYNGTMIHDGWSPYDQFKGARHQQCLNHLLRRADGMAATATRGAVIFPRRVAEVLRAGLDLRDRHAAGEISRHGLAVARGRLESQLFDLVFPARTNAANERLAQHPWAHRDHLFSISGRNAKCDRNPDSRFARGRVRGAAREPTRDKSPTDTQVESNRWPGWRRVRGTLGGDGWIARRRQEPGRSVREIDGPRTVRGWRQVDGEKQPGAAHGNTGGRDGQESPFPHVALRATVPAPCYPRHGPAGRLPSAPRPPGPGASRSPPRRCDGGPGASPSTTSPAPAGPTGRGGARASSSSLTAPHSRRTWPGR
jgi:hypothetical protein